MFDGEVTNQIKLFEYKHTIVVKIIQEGLLRVFSQHGHVIFVLSYT